MKRSTPLLLLAALLGAPLALAQPPGGASGDGIWLRNAYFGEASTFDGCLGHQPGSGQYHHHADPVCLRAQLNDNLQVVRTSRNGATYQEKTAPWTHSPILGWAYDGFPIYGPYGYSDPTNASSAVKRLQPGFQLRNIAARTTLPDWVTPLHAGVAQQLTSSQYGPAISATYPLGRYLEDFEFVAGLGDLDIYNGRFSVTPEFPQGTYAYYVTIDQNGLPAFPYIFAAQFYGTASGGTAATVPASAVDYFVNGAYAQTASTTPELTSWATKNSQQSAEVVSAFDPSAGPQTTWPTEAIAGAKTSGGVGTPTPSDTQHIRYNTSTVYVNANGLASYSMGPWFDALQSGGVFAAFPANQNSQVQLPLAPAAAATRKNVGMGPQGVWVNGVAVFNAEDGASYSNAQGIDIGGGLVGLAAFHVSAASFEAGPMAPGSLVTAFSLFGTPLATSTATAPSTTWPTTLGGATVTVKDSSGVVLPATIYYASPGQINYCLPTGLAAGYATVTISAGSVSATGNINIGTTYPNLFLANSQALAAAYLIRIHNGQQSVESVTASPINLAAATDQVYLIVVGSGLGTATTATATIGGVAATVASAGPQGTYSGLDQYNILIPAALAGKGKVDVVVTAGGKRSNPVNITIQ